MDPQELMAWVNDFLQEMAQLVLEHGGLIEDYTGDGMMACFGVPLPRPDAGAIRRDARNAVECALDMERAIRRLNSKWRGRGLPTVGIRIGLDTGQVVAGELGSENRLKYTVVGDSVQTAQRLEALDHSDHDFEKKPCRILISGETREHLDGSFGTDRVGEFLLKGKAEPVTIYSVAGRADASDRAATEDV
jgi:adenylate cyclase